MFKMKRQWKRIISTIMAVLMIFTVMPSNFSSSAAETATPGDADQTGYVRIEAKLPEVESAKKGGESDVTGVVYEVYKDASCENEVGAFVLSCDGKAYSKDDEPVVYSDKEKVNKKNLSYLELEKGTYYYQMAKNLYKSENAPSDQNVLYDDQIYTFTLSAKANKKKAIVLKPEIIAISQTATPTDAVKDEAATEDVATPSDAEFKTDITEASMAEEVTENLTEESSAEKSATKSDAEEKAVEITNPVTTIAEFVQKMLLTTYSSSSYGNGSELSPAKNWYYDDWIKEMKSQTSATKFDGTYNSFGGRYYCAEWVWNYYIKSKTVNEASCLKPTNNNIQSTGAIMTALDNDSSHWQKITTITGVGSTNDAKRENAAQVLFAQIDSATVQAGDILIFKRNGVTQHIGILSNMHREDGALGIWQSNGAANSKIGLGKLYQTAINVAASSGADSFVVYRMKKPNNGVVSVTKKLDGKTSADITGIVFKLYKVNDLDDEWNSTGSVKVAEFTINKNGVGVPKLSGSIGTISGNQVTGLPYGTYLMEEDGSTVDASKMNKAEHQYCVLSDTEKEYAFAFNNTTKKYPYIYLTKESTVSGTPIVNDYNYTGITYKFFESKSTSGTKINSYDAVDDGDNHVSVGQVVLSYDGKAYMDGSGKNIVFTSKEAKEKYKKTGKDLSKFRFYLNTSYAGKTVYAIEAANLWGNSGKNSYYYNESGVNQYTKAGSGVAASGFLRNSSWYSIKVPNDGSVSVTAKDTPLTGKVRVSKKIYSGGDITKADGVIIWLSRKNEDGDFVHVGTFRINKSGWGIPTSVTSAGSKLGIYTNYAGEDVQTSSKRNILGLPFGTYRVSEVDDKDLTLVSPAKGYYEFTISEANFDTDGTFKNNLTGSTAISGKTEKTFEFTNKYVVRARLTKGSTTNATAYSMAGIKYGVYSDADAKTLATSTSIHVFGLDTVPASRFVLSYDGKAYMDDDGKNIVFVSKAAKDAYVGNDGELHQFIWATDKTGSTFYYKEISTLLSKSDTGNAYYYDDGTVATKTLINNLSNKSVRDIGFAIDSTVHKLNLGQNTVENSTSDTPMLAKVRIKKTLTKGDIAKADGVTVYLEYRNGSTWEQVGTFRINKSGAGVPISVTAKGTALGIYTNYTSSENVQSSGKRNLLGLPYGSYRLREYDTKGLKPVSPATGIYVFTVSEVNFDDKGNFLPATLYSTAKDSGYTATGNANGEYQFEFENTEIVPVTLAKSSKNASETSNTDMYNMAGIKYVVYKADKKTSATSVAFTSDGVNVTTSTRFVLSYDGKAYMDDAGVNVVFVSKAAKDDYVANGGKLHYYVWAAYKNNNVYYCQEQATLMTDGDSGKAYYYRPENTKSALYASNEALIKKHSGASLSTTGFVRDDTYLEIKFDTATTNVDLRPSDDYYKWGRLELSKEPSVGTDVINYNYYNMAGISYEIYDGNTTSATKVTSSAHTRSDGISVKTANRIVLSYDGKAYMDADGKNVVFVSSSAKTAYNATGKGLYIYRWYKHGLTGNSASYYYKESSTLLKSNDGSNAYYYNPSNAYKTAIDARSNQSISITGYQIDSNYHKFTFYFTKTDAHAITKEVEAVTTDNIQSAKVKATKLYTGGSASELNGVKFSLYKVSGNNASYNTNNRVGTFVHNGTSLVPTTLYENIPGVTIGTGTDAAYFTNLPFGWYCLVEDAATAQARGFSVADPVYLEAKRGSTTLNFSMSDERSGLRLRKQYDDKAIGGLCNYSLAEATYEVYKTTANGIASTTEHVCTFTTNANGEGYVSWYDQSKYYALADTRADKHSYKLVGIPIGTWLYVKEKSASAGCELDSKAYYLHFTADNMSQTVTSTEPLKNDPISIQISKEDTTSSEEAGAASLAGAEFTVKYYDVDVSGTINKDTLYAKVKTMTPARTWVYKTDENGFIDMGIPSKYLIANKSNALYYGKTGNPIFPYGCITIEETKAPTGYTKTGKFTTTDNKDKSNADGVIFAVINKDYTTEKFIGTNALIKKEVPLRGDIKFKKVALDTGKPLSGIAFRITSKTTGESHVVVTDENGMIDTAALKHSSNTNAADKDLATVSGTWFYGNKDCKGSVNDSFGALPYDTYTIEELATETNKMYRLVTPVTVDLTDSSKYTNGYQLYDLGSITNVPEPWIETYAMSTDTEDNVVPANTKVDVKDICSYNYLESGKKYTIKGVIMDPVTEKPFVQADGTYSLGHYTFTVPADATGYHSDAVEIPFVIDTTGLEDRNVVVAEYVFEGEDDSDLTVKEDGTVDTTGVLTTHTSELVAHTDLSATTQTLSVPKIGTTALGVETETHFVLNAGIIKFKDIVGYRNVIPGKTYELSATVMDKDTGKPLLDVDGNEITSSATFTPEDRNGSAEVEFTCDASKVDFRDKAIVLFEDLRYNKITLTTHADLTDEGQTLYFPDVTSTLAETETGNKKPFYSKDMKLTDVVTLSNIPKSTVTTKFDEDGNAYNEEAAGAKLTITDVLYNKRTKKPVMLGGNEVSKTIEVFVSEDDVSYSIDFEFDGTKTDLYNAEDGSIADVVAFVYIYDDKGNLIAKEEELGNADQTITLDVPETEVKVNKVWDDADNQDGIRLDSVEVQLYKDNDVAVGKPITLAASNDWSYTWTGLKAEENAETINYYIKEVSIPDEYSCKIVKTDENSFSYTITNTHKPGETVINVNKIWADSDDQDGIRPESIEVQLYKNGKAFGDAITLSEDNDWSYSWTDLDKFESGKEIKYTVDEVKVPENYKKTVTSEGTTFEITNTHKPEKTKVSVVKVWDDSDDQDGIRPASVKVQLLADGEAVGKVITLSSKNDWSHTWKGLDKMSAGKEIKYTVDEVEVPEDYTKTITNEQTAFTITNTYKPEKTKVSVVKVWDDADDQDGFRPASIKVRLYKDGDALGKIVTLSKDNEWKYAWEDLPKYEAGKEIKYTVDEVSVPSEYTKTVTNEQTAFTITNTHKTRETEISVVKVWDDNNDQDQIRPASIEVKLTADGEQIGDTVKLSEKNEWKYEWKNLPLLANGKKIKYSVDEVKVPTDYIKTITNKGTKFTITNTHKPGTTEISVVKVWDDNNDQDGIRPTTIDVRLLADGEPVGEVVELSENNDWAYTWSNLDKQVGDKTITYTVDEVEVPSGYTKTVTNDQTAFTITNTHKPGTTAVKVTKVWKDNNDKYQIRPDSIKVQLYKGEGNNKEKVGEPITLTEKDNWTYTWTDLAKTEDGKEIVYTVDEIEVPSGYKKTVSKDTDSSNITAFIITNSKPDTPKTGDSFRLIPVAILMVAAFVTGVFVWRKKRKNK